MNEGSSGIFVACTNRGAFVRVMGRGSYRNAQPLRQFGLEIVARDGAMIFCDLAQCQGMDSTFLGVLAGFGLKFHQLGRKDGLQLFNADTRSRELCQSLGLDRLARIEPGVPETPEFQLPPDSEYRLLPDTDLTALSKPADQAVTASVMLEAHEDLCRADERNETKFKDVKNLLREEIAQRATQEK
jgi:anti-anti-sigma regulatory factor